MSKQPSEAMKASLERLNKYLLLRLQTAGDALGPQPYQQY
jgi:hypothetical protein